MISKAKLVGTDYDPDEYHKEDAPRGDAKFVMSRSNLAMFAHCPSRWKDGYATGDSDSTEWGSMMDCLVTMPQRFDQKLAVKPSKYMTTGMECPVCKSVTDSKKCSKCKCDRVEVKVEKDWSGNATECKEWAAKQDGKMLVNRTDFDEAGIALARLRKDEAIAEYLDCSAKQVYCTAEWHDKATGIVVPLKVLLDLVPSNAHAEYGRSLGDFKTGRDAALRKWQRQISDFNYHWQAALFTDVYVAATGEDRVDFRHIVQENVPPYQTAKRIIGGEFVELGRNYYQLALKRYCECLKTGIWPDYDTNEDGWKGWSFVAPEAWMVGK